MADPSTAQSLDSHEDDAEQSKSAITGPTSTSASTSTQRPSRRESTRRGKAKFVFGEEAEDHEQDIIDNTTPKAHTQYHSTYTTNKSEQGTDDVPSERISSERDSHTAGTGEAGPSSMAKTLIDSTVIQPMQSLALTQEPGLGRIPETQQQQGERATRPVKESNRIRSRSGEPPKTTTNPDKPKQRLRAPSDTMPLSKRVPSLLNRSISSTSIPAVTKVTAQNVLAMNPVGGSTSTSPSSSSMTDNSAHPGSKLASPTVSSPTSVQGHSSAAEMVSKFLHAKAASSSTSSGSSQQNFHTRSRSHSNLRSVQESTSPTSPNHRQSPSAHPPSTATSPHQRTITGYTSKFYPASPSRAQLSSSAPKSTTLNTGTSTNTNIMIPQGLAMMTGSEDPSSESPYYNGVPVPSAIAAAAEAQSNLTGESKSAKLSRTQQKLWLQRDNLQDVDEDEMARRGKILKDMDRVHREYKCVRMTLDPSLESLSRCLARLGKSPLDLQRGLHQGHSQANESFGYGQQQKLQQQFQRQQQQQQQQQYQQVGLGLRPS
ncbi:hypothetical protein BGZ81_001812 [Podila clonocystis]|nr:hypothetical protein BGZ81_001812 [Podila clonocystis]